MASWLGTYLGSWPEVPPKPSDNCGSPKSSPITGSSSCKRIPVWPPGSKLRQLFAGCTGVLLRRSRVAQGHRKQLSLPVQQMANHRINSLVPAVVIADFCNKIGQERTFKPTAERPTRIVVNLYRPCLVSGVASILGMGHNDASRCNRQCVNGQKPGDTGVSNHVRSIERGNCRGKSVE